MNEDSIVLCVNSISVAAFINLLEKVIVVPDSLQSNSRLLNIVVLKEGT